MVFMHGAGYGTCDNSFGDMASDLSSAGFVTAVLDKPVWSTNDANRDYPGSAAAIDDQVINLLRKMDTVDASKWASTPLPKAHGSHRICCRRSGRRFSGAAQSDGLRAAVFAGLPRRTGLRARRRA